MIKPAIPLHSLSVLTKIVTIGLMLALIAKQGAQLKSELQQFV